MARVGHVAFDHAVGDERLAAGVEARAPAEGVGGVRVGPQLVVADGAGVDHGAAAREGADRAAVGRHVRQDRAVGGSGERRAGERDAGGVGHARDRGVGAARVEDRQFGARAGDRDVESLVEDPGEDLAAGGVEGAFAHVDRRAGRGQRQRLRHGREGRAGGAVARGVGAGRGDMQVGGGGVDGRGGRVPAEVGESGVGRAGSQRGPAGETGLGGRQGALVQTGRGGVQAEAEDELGLCGDVAVDAGGVAVGDIAARQRHGAVDIVAVAPEDAVRGADGAVMPVEAAGAVEGDGAEIQREGRRAVVGAEAVAEDVVLGAAADVVVDEAVEERHGAFRVDARPALGILAEDDVVARDDAVGHGRRAASGDVESRSAGVVAAFADVLDLVVENRAVGQRRGTRVDDRDAATARVLVGDRLRLVAGNRAVDQGVARAARDLDSRAVGMIRIGIEDAAGERDVAQLAARDARDADQPRGCVTGARDDRGLRAGQPGGRVVAAADEDGLPDGDGAGDGVGPARKLNRVVGSRGVDGGLDVAEGIGPGRPGTRAARRDVDSARPGCRKGRESR